MKSQMAANWKQLKLSPASVPAYASILFLHSVKASLQWTAGKSPASICECEESCGFQTHCAKRCFKKRETRTVKTVAGPDYLLQDNEQLNYRREQSFLRNIKRLPVRSEKLLRRNQFLPPPRGKAEPLARTKHQRFVPTKTISICSHQEVIIYSKNILYNCINSRSQHPVEEVLSQCPLCNDDDYSITK